MKGYGKSRLRRTMLLLPGNNANMINQAARYGADSIVFDLEDSVTAAEKDAARQLVKYALQFLPFRCETAVRINHVTQTPFGIDDLLAILPSKPNLIVLPKTESAGEVRLVTAMIEEAEQQHGFAPGSIRMMCAIESERGLRKVGAIAKEPRVAALALGGEGELDVHHARSRIAMAARESGIQAIDAIYPDVYNLEGFRRETAAGKDLGFSGTAVVHPLQIDIVHELYQP